MFFKAEQSAKWLLLRCFQGRILLEPMLGVRVCIQAVLCCKPNVPQGLYVKSMGQELQCVFVYSHWTGSVSWGLCFGQLSEAANCLKGQDIFSE